MVKSAWILLLSLSASPAWAAVDCRDVNKVAKEAIDYALVGAWEPFTTHACFKNEKFRYFQPQLGSPTGEVTDAKKLIWFDKKTDHYKIESVKKTGRDYEIAVNFTIHNRSLHTKYLYRPQPGYAKKNGACGFVVNYDHGIYRRDCVAPGRLPAAK
jgi:hypothetical protein